MSILMYKQRHCNPNLKTTPNANYAHIRYIATRPGVLKNSGMSHGLFGKLSPGELTEFEDWQNVAKLVYQHAKNHTVMYRSIISFQEETARELELNNQKDWQRYIENHILTIAEQNGIKRENLQWACAVHGEKEHPHIHIVFWDTSSRIRNAFVAPATVNAIRIKLIKETFPHKIREYAEQKNLAIKELRRISDELAEQYEKHLRKREPESYRILQETVDTEEKGEPAPVLSDSLLSSFGNHLLKLRFLMPRQGRIAYQLLPPEGKEATDEAVRFLLAECEPLRKVAEAYVDSKMKLAWLYNSEETYLAGKKQEFRKEADKIIANRVLAGVRMLIRLESEGKTEAYLNSRKDFFAYQIILETLDMLNRVILQEEECISGSKKVRRELSKAAKKELYLKNQDKGYEH